MSETKSDTDAAPAAVKETVIISDSKAALRRIGTAALISAGIAIAQIAAETLPHAVEVAVALIPPGWLWVVPAIKIGSASVAAWLLKVSMRKHKDAVATALELPPPDSEPVEKYYGK